MSTVVETTKEASPFSIPREIILWGKVVVFPHSVFALPFALSMFAVVSKTHAVSLLQFIYIIIAMVAARSAAMGFNRLVDARYDSLNPRTIGRELPQGKVSRKSVTFLVGASTAVFLLVSWGLGAHCLVLAPLVLVVLFGYSYTKRFTEYSHLVLGLSLALAPGGVWYAITAEVAFLPIFMMAGVLLWVGGFDILYSCQDVEFDRKLSLHSIPARLGVKKAFLISRCLHALSVLLLVVFGIGAHMGFVYFGGLFLFGVVLASQHLIISPTDLSRINAAFFTRNGIASVLYFAAVLVDVVISKIGS